MLTFDNITSERQGRDLFCNLGFTVGDSCLLVIRGNNGAGKTTLLKIIAGICKPKSGQILYANKEVLGEHYAEYCDIIQYIGHKNALKLYFTVRENIEFWAKLKDNLKAVDAALSFFDLEEYADQKIVTLSQGYQRRVALARLMVTNSDIWLLDEPFANLDALSSHMLATLISAKCERGGSVILTSHGDIPISNYSQINLEEFTAK